MEERDPPRLSAMPLYTNLDRIARGLAAQGIRPGDPIRPEQLFALDQWHYHGTEAIAAAAHALGLGSQSRVLDIGAGVGGPARYLAHTIGCHVTALELQPEVHAIGVDLTHRSGLADRVTHICGDALVEPLPDAGFDAGTDAGVPVDGGFDGGADAGFDAGPNDAGVVIDPDAGIPFPEDAGYLAMDFDGRGNTVFARGSRTSTDVLAVGEPGPGSPVSPAMVYTLPFPVTKPLSRVDDLLCLPDIFSGTSNGCWLAPATESVLCFTPPTGVIGLTTGTSSTQDLGQPSPGGTAGAHGSPRTYLAPNDAPTCGPAWSFLAPGNFLALQPRTSTPFGPCAAQTVTRLLPIPDGSFAIAATLECGVATSIPGYVVVRVGTQGTITGTYFAKQDVVLPTPPPTVLGVLSDGRVVTMRNEPPFTTFEAWPPDGSPPTATARVPGLYLYNGGGRLAADLNAADDGSLTVLLNSATLGDMVLHFGPGLTPRWLYRYARIVQNSSLVAGDDQGTVYYVDPLNNAIVALRRF